MNYMSCMNSIAKPCLCMYTRQQKKHILFNINLIQETVIKIYPDLYEYVWPVSCIRSGPFYLSLHS